LIPNRFNIDSSPPLAFTPSNLFQPSRTTISLKFILKMSSFLKSESSFTRSITAESIKISQNYEKKWKILIWAYYRRPISDENQKYLYYSYCSSESYSDNYERPYNTKNSTNMTTYLRRHHDITAKKSLNKN
jgi:hypothetical protein